MPISAGTSRRVRGGAGGAPPPFEPPRNTSPQLELVRGPETLEDSDLLVPVEEATPPMGVPPVEPAPALIVPGHDATHATSAARYLEECLPNAQYWDVPAEALTEQNAAARLLEFLTSVDTSRR